MEAITNDLRVELRASLVRAPFELIVDHHDPNCGRFRDLKGVLPRPIDLAEVYVQEHERLSNSPLDKLAISKMHITDVHLVTGYVDFVLPLVVEEVEIRDPVKLAYGTITLSHPTSKYLPPNLVFRFLQDAIIEGSFRNPCYDSTHTQVLGHTRRICYTKACLPHDLCMLEIDNLHLPVNFEELSKERQKEVLFQVIRKCAIKQSISVTKMIIDTAVRSRYLYPPLTMSHLHLLFQRVASITKPINTPYDDKPWNPQQSNQVIWEDPC